MAEKKHTDAELDAYIGRQVNYVVDGFNAYRTAIWLTPLNSPLDRDGHITPTAKAYVKNIDGIIDRKKDGVLQHDELREALVGYLGMASWIPGANDKIAEIYNYAGRDSKAIAAYIDRREAELGLKIEHLDDKLDKPAILATAKGARLDFQGSEVALVDALGTIPIQPKPRTQTAHTP